LCEIRFWSLGEGEAKEEEEEDVVVAVAVVVFVFIIIKDNIKIIIEKQDDGVWSGFFRLKRRQWWALVNTVRNFQVP
jgi:hypothetical protein